MMMFLDEVNDVCLFTITFIISIITITANAQTLHKAYEKQYIGQLYIQLEP